MDKIRLFIVTKNGKMAPVVWHKKIIDVLGEQFEIVDIGFGRAYNMAIYLLGEIENNPDEACVVALDYDENLEIPYPRVLINEEEILLLIEALEANLERNSWETVVEVNKKIRGEQATMLEDQQSGLENLE